MDFLRPFTSLPLTERARHRREFHDTLFRAVEDGKLTEKEMAEISEMKDEYGLTEEDIRPVRVQLYVQAFQAAAEDEQVTEMEWNEMEKIQAFLGIQDREVAPTKKELLRLHILREIQGGNLPLVRPRNLALLTDEKAYWIQKASATVLEDKAETDWKQGELVITSKRVIFRKIAKSYVIRLSQIVNITRSKRGLVISESNGNAAVIAFEGSRGEIAHAVLAQALRDR